MSPSINRFMSSFLLPAVIAAAFPAMAIAQDDQRLRARDLGIDVGVLPVGKHNAITDVGDVRVGHRTLVHGESVRTGVTVVLPHGDDLYQNKVPAAFYAGNAFGKFAGSTQIEELGNIETSIALTNTLSVSTCTGALIKHTLQQPGNERVRSVNAVVAETNDGYLNDIRGMHVKESDLFAAVQSAAVGPVEEGSVGAGTGTVCFGFKGGIGTSSRVLPDQMGGYSVGVLVQTNFGGILTINGAPAGRELGQYAYSQIASVPEDGSCIVVIATDAPLSPRNLKRLAKRSMFGLARTGSTMSNGSGDYAIAFTTAWQIGPGSEKPASVDLLSNNRMSPLFLAVVEATEEAVYNSLLMATSVQGRDGNSVSAISTRRVSEILKSYHLLHLNDRLPSITHEDR